MSSSCPRGESTQVQFPGRPLASSCCCCCCCCCCYLFAFRCRERTAALSRPGTEKRNGRTAVAHRPPITASLRARSGGRGIIVDVCLLTPGPGRQPRTSQPKKTLEDIRRTLREPTKNQYGRVKILQSHNDPLITTHCSNPTTITEQTHHRQTTNRPETDHRQVPNRPPTHCRQTTDRPQTDHRRTRDRHTDEPQTDNKQTTD